MRLEDAAALTTLVMAADRPWTGADTAARVGQGRTETINLERRLPIWIVYLTAWVGDDGRVNFRRDVYGKPPHYRFGWRGHHLGIHHSEIVGR